MAQKLTDLALKSKLKSAAAGGKATRIQAGDGLSLLTHAGMQSGTWTYRYQLDGKRRDMGMGAYPGIGLAEARARAAEARVLAKRGSDPLDERQAKARKRKTEASEDRSFKAVAETCIAAREGGWKNEKHAAQWRSTLQSLAYPILGKIKVDHITVEDVLAVLKPIWTKTPETASRLRGRIEAVLDYAAARGLRRGENAARWRGNLAELLHAPRKGAAGRVQHQPALPWALIPAFFTALFGKSGMAAAALRFGILTAARSGEVRGATWGEIDIEGAVWIIPGRRMKGGVLHRVPLSAAALAVLQAMRADTNRPPVDALVFPGRGSKPLSDMALSMLVRGMCSDGLQTAEPARWRDAEGRPIVVHGFRSCFRDWAGETQADGHILAEKCLAHANRNKVESAYARSDLLERRRPLMDRWAELCTGAAKVVAFRSISVAA